MRFPAVTRNFLLQAIECWPAGFVLLDAEGNVIYANREFAETFAKPIDKLLGRRLRDLAINAPTVDTILAKLSADDYFESEIKTHNKRGKATSLRFVAGSVRNHDRTLLGTILMLQGAREAGTTHTQIAESMRIIVSQTSEPLLLTIGEVAARLRVSRDTVLRLIHRGELRAIKIGRNVRIRTSDVDIFINQPE